MLFYYFNYSPIAKYAYVDGKSSLNCASYNFLNFIGNKQIEVCNLIQFFYSEIFIKK